MKAKLLYGLEAVHITQPQISRLETLHLKGLRQILEITATYVDRTHTNKYVYARATEAVRALRRERRDAAECVVRPLRHDLTDRCIIFLGHGLRKCDEDPMRSCTFEPGSARPIRPEKLRVGRPRDSCVEKTLKAAWNRLREGVGLPLAGFSVRNAEHLWQVQEAAAHRHL